MSLSLFVCGDYVNSLGNSNWAGIELRKLIKDVDFSVVNLEAPVYTDGMIPISKVGPHLYQSEHAISYLKSVGIDCVTIANNHIYDYGETALLNTLNILKENNIHVIGGGRDFEEAYSPYIYAKDNIVVGMLGACENEFGCLYEKKDRGGYAWLFSSYLEDAIKLLKFKVDYVVLFAHAGLENIPFPIKEWRDRYKRLCDLGVDIIVGHHPHVPQGWEEYNNCYIFYSLGNFYFDTANFASKSDDSYSVVLDFSKDNFSFEIITHKKRDLTVEIDDDVDFSVDGLNKLLDFDYDKNNSIICHKAYKEYYYSYYQIGVGIAPKNARFYYKFKSLIKKYFIKRYQDESYQGLMLLHNIRIDTHRFVVQRALSELYEE